VRDTLVQNSLVNKDYLETIKVFDGKIYNLSYHQERYNNVINQLGIQKTKQLKEYINPPSVGLYRCRIFYNANNISVTYHPYIKKDIHSLKIVFDDTIEYQKKYANRDNIDILYQQKGICDDVLIIKNSFVTDTSIANIAFYKDGVWRTPKSPLLQGTTRKRLLKEKKIIEEEIRVEDIDSFTGVALMNAMIDFDILESCKFLL